MTADRIWYIVGKNFQERLLQRTRRIEKLLHDHPDLHYSIQNITDLGAQKSRIKQKH